MKLQIYQVATALISLLFVYYTLRQFFKSKAGIVETFVWIFFWIVFVFLSLFPDRLSNNIAQILGIKSNINAVIFLALGVILFVLYRMNASIRKQNERLTELVRKLALKEEEEENL